MKNRLGKMRSVRQVVVGASLIFTLVIALVLSLNAHSVSSGEAVNDVPSIGVGICDENSIELNIDKCKLDEKTLVEPEKIGESVVLDVAGVGYSNVTPEYVESGNVVSFDYRNYTSFEKGVNLSVRFRKGEAFVSSFEKFVEVKTDITVFNDTNTTIINGFRVEAGDLANLTVRSFEWVEFPFVREDDESETFDVYTFNYLLGERVRYTPIALVMNRNIKYDVITSSAKTRLINMTIDPILYGSNIALTATNCYANETYPSPNVNGTGNYGCQKLYDNAITPFGSCWIAYDNSGGTMKVGAYTSIQLNRSYNIGTINITQGMLSSYQSGNVSVEFSTDSTDGKDTGSWVKVAQANMSSVDTSSVNLTNVNGFGNATWIRFNVTNSSSADTNKAIGLCEVKVYEYQAPAGGGYANESQGDSAIELGINSSLPSAVKYSSQQVYVRNLSNNQALGAFDWVASYGSQRWLFNYVTGGESYINAPNLTTAVYVLEITSKTSAQITDEVSRLINATKS